MILTYSCEKDGMSVYTAMRRELMISSTLLRRLKYLDAIFVNGSPVYTTHILSAGDTLTVELSGAEEPADVPVQNGPLDILYEDDGLLILNKPCGTLVHPSHAKYEDSLLNYALGYLRDKGEPLFLHPANRLDRDTSGVVVFAKSGYMMERMCSALTETGEKTYFALVLGTPEPHEGVIDAPIRRIREHDMERIVAPDGKEAVTHYTVLESFPCGASLLRLRLETGRTHQIRVHTRHIGHPILGDALYGTPESRALSETLSIPTQALHAGILSFTHPLTGERLTFTAPVVREELKKYAGVQSLFPL